MVDSGHGFGNKKLQLEHGEGAIPIYYMYTRISYILYIYVYRMVSVEFIAIKLMAIKRVSDRILFDLFSFIAFLNGFTGNVSTGSKIDLILVCFTLNV